MANEELLRLKVQILMYGVDINFAILDLFNGTYKENNYGYNNPNKTCDERILRYFPTELILGKVVMVSFRYDSESRLRVDLIGDDLYLVERTDGHTRIRCEVEFTERPKFWSLYTESGISMKRIGSVYGRSALTFFLLNYCEFFSHESQCIFCGLKNTYDSLQAVERAKKIEDICEVYIAASNECYPFTNFIGGSLYNSDTEFKRYIECVDAITSRVGTTLNGYVVTQPPMSIRLLEELKLAGINGVKFNLEVSNEELFAKLCPGKAKLGYSFIEDRLRQSIEVFSENHVYTNLILGLEPLTDAIHKAEQLATYGIGTVVHILHTDNIKGLSRLDFEVEEVIEFYRKLNDINIRYGLTPWLDIDSSRGDLSWDLYNRSNHG